MSIPKIIHFVWFSAEIPPQTQERIRCWKLLMPDYRIMHWNAETFDVESCRWVKEAVERKMWAFATDYIRFWALRKYGGIYLDTDVQVLKPFDDLLSRPYFLGMEQTKAIVEAAVLGAAPDCFWLDDVLSYYENRSFIDSQGSMSVLPLPRIILQTLTRKYGFVRIENPDQFDPDTETIQILPPKFFSPKRWDSDSAGVTENTYCIHLFEGAWLCKKKGLVSSLNNCKRKIMSAVRLVIGEERWQNMNFLLFTRIHKR